jgi:hypothetical protein
MAFRRISGKQGSERVKGRTTATDGPENDAVLYRDKKSRFRPTISDGIARSPA